jgi:hypothetical protein
MQRGRGHVSSAEHLLRLILMHVTGADGHAGSGGCVSSRKVTEILREAGKETIERNSLTDPESTSVLIAVQDSRTVGRDGNAARFRALLYG